MEVIAEVKFEQKKPPIRIAGSAEASVGSTTAGRDARIFSTLIRKARFFCFFLAAGVTASFHGC